MINYEEGIKICNSLYKILNDTEGKIKILTAEGEKDFMELRGWKLKISLLYIIFTTYKEKKG